MSHTPEGGEVRKLPVASSLLLDAVRFGAAVVVAVGHLTQPHFSVCWPDLTVRAVQAVAVFFVLSGFVIRYITRLKYADIGEYWVDRASRIYSVVLPAAAFTIVADLIAYRVNPHFYLANWGDAVDHPLLRLVTNLTFTSQVWSKSIGLFSNGPFWSLSYECFYYVIYGCAFYLTGAKRAVSVAGVILLGGIHIFLLFPLWLLGCVLYELYERLRGRASAAKESLVLLAIGCAGALLWKPVSAMVFAAKNRVTLLFLAHHRAPVNLHWVLDYYRVGIPAAFLLLWLLLVADRLPAQARSAPARTIRLLSEGTFPLYLFHFPMYVLAAALFPYNHANAWAKTAILAVAVAVGVLLAWPTDRLKLRLRRWLRRWFLRGDPMPAPRIADVV
jgi:peptidoglycan/LPS O-acetylase OafA/YrhL